MTHVWITRTQDPIATACVRLRIFMPASVDVSLGQYLLLCVPSLGGSWRWIGVPIAAWRGADGVLEVWLEPGDEHRPQHALRSMTVICNVCQLTSCHGSPCASLSGGTNIAFEKEVALDKASQLDRLRPVDDTHSGGRYRAFLSGPYGQHCQTRHHSTVLMIADGVSRAIYTCHAAVEMLESRTGSSVRTLYVVLRLDQTGKTVCPVSSHPY